MKEIKEVRKRERPIDSGREGEKKTRIEDDY